MSVIMSPVVRMRNMKCEGENRTQAQYECSKMDGCSHRQYLAMSVREAVSDRHCHEWHMHANHHEHCQRGEVG